ncbi:MAG: efflux RND transporter permease subunit, partial [Pseudomonadota bacterium]
MSTLFFRDKRLFALALLMMIAAGASALSTIGRQEDPTITNLFATIVTPFPGADPARVEALVTEKIEEELREIPQIDVITSTSRLGISVLQVELSQFISDEQIEQTWSEIRDALSDAAQNFPAGVPEPNFDNDRTGAFTNIVAFVAEDGVEVSPAILSRFAKMLQDRLRAVGGTKLVELYGAQQEEIRVTVDPIELLSRGLTSQAISDAIARADAKVRAGQVRGDANDILIEVAGELKALDRIRAIPVLQGDDGRIVRVGDLATVAKTVREPASTLALVGGKPAVIVGAKMEDDLQVQVWSEKIKRVQAEFEADMPTGLELRRMFDQARYTADRLAGVLENMAIGIGLVIAVLFVSLGVRAAFIVAMIIPLAALTSIFGLKMLGVSIHQMSLTGLIVSLGLLVDAAIVMTDDVRKRLTDGATRLQAVGGAVDRLAGPLLASTVTTVLAFMPMALLPGPAGDFVGSIALAVITMLVVSLGLALTITPAMAGWLLRAPRPGQRRSALSEGLSFDTIGRGFTAVLRLSLRHPGLSMLAALAVPAVGFASFPTLKPQFFPGVDRDQLYIQVQLSEGTAINKTLATAEKIDGILAGVKEIETVSWVVGASAPAFYYNMIANQDGVSSFAEALVTTTSPAATEAILDPLQRQLNAAVPQARIIVRGLVQGPPVNAPVELRLVGQSLDTLRDLGEQIRLAMLEVPGVSLARTELGAGAPKLVLALREERVRLAGMDLVSVAGQLESQLEGTTGGSIVEGSEELPVRVRVNDATRGSLNALDALDIASPQARTGAQDGRYPGIPIDALGTVQLTPADPAIYRRNGERTNTVQAFVDRNVLPEAALQDVKAALEKRALDLPAGYRIETGGDSDARDETLRNLIGVLGLIIALTIATIVMTFGSYRLSLVTAVVAIAS